MANTVSKMANTGIMYTSGEIDELSINPAAQGSILFNGSSQYLSLPASSAFAFGTSNFTIECWVYPTTAPISTPVASTVKAIYGYRNGADTSPYLFWAFTGGVSFGGDITTYLTSNVQLTLNVWTHIAVVRIGTAMNMYINGTSVASNSSVSQSFSDSANVRYIGFFNGTNGYYWPGYISNLRIVNGVGVYTGAFTVPKLPLQKTQFAGTNITALTNSANTSLLLSTLYNNAFKDFSDNNFTVANTATPTSSIFQPFNPDKYNSVYFNGTSTSYIYTPYNVNQTLGTNNFTIEGWIYPTNLSLQGYIISSWYGVGGQFYLRVTTNGRLQFNFTVTGDSGQSLQATTSIISANAWHHVAVVRNGATITLYINGTADLNTFNIGSTALIYRGGVQKDIYIGKDGTTSSLFYAGYMYNMRIVNGTAVYTGNFSPPTEPLTAIANTQLLVFVNKTITEASSGLTLNNTTGVFPGQSLQPLPLSYANTGIAVSKQYSNGALQTTSILDEETLNTNLPGSVSFNGTTQCLVFPLNEAFNLNTGDFTLEAWIMPTTATIPQWACIFGGVNYGASSDYVLQAGSGPNVGNYPYANFTNSQADNINSSVALVPFKWQHIALTRKKGVSAMFIDGVLTGITYNPTSSMNNTLQKGIGGGYNGNVNTLFPGYISNLRLVKGLAIYSGNWDSPNTTLTTTSQGANGGQVSLLTAIDTFIGDSSGIFGWPITNYNSVTTSNTVIPFAGATSFAFNGINQYLKVENGGSPSAYSDAFNTGTNDFTIEMWVYPTEVASGNIYGKRLSDAAASAVILAVGGTGFFRVVVANATGDGLVIDDNSVPYSINTWHHIVLTRSSVTYGSYIYFYVNGNLKFRGLINTGAPNLIYNSNALITIGASHVSPTNAFFKGYISNFRFVLGKALYQKQTVFTPPSRSLEVTQQASANIAAITNKSQVSLLLETTKTGYADVGANNLPITPRGTPPASRQNPFLTNPNGYFSNFFAGGSSNQKLSIAASSAFDLSGGTWTIEFWMYATAFPGAGQQCRMLMFGTNGTSNSYYVGLTPVGSTGSTAGILAYVPLGSPTGIDSGATALSLNTWYHVALVCNAGSAILYLNGTQVGGPSSILLPTSGNVTLNIGYDTAAGVTYQYSGYLSNLRIVKGTAVYTSNFTPSTSPLTAITNTSLLTCQSGAIRDNSTNVFTITNTGVTVNDTFTPFTALANTAPTITSGTTLRKQYNTGDIQIINQLDEVTVNPWYNSNNYSVAFNGVSQYSRINTGGSSAFDFGTGNFTCECWIYLPSANFPTRGDSSKTTTLFDFGSSATNDQQSFAIAGSSTVTGTSFEMFVPTNGYSYASPTFSSPISYNAWHHIAYVRNGDTFTGYLDGVAYTYSQSMAGLSFGSSTNLIKIGGSWLDTYLNQFFGYISNVRIVKGVAVYTGNFTPPTSKLQATQPSGTNISAITGTQTSLLTYQDATIIDNSTNSFYINSPGVPTTTNRVIPFV